MNTLEYSIVYAEIRPEIQERVSVGIVFCQEGVIEIRYSTAKLSAVKSLVPSADYDYLCRALKSLSINKKLDSVATIDYLNRYSNNILTVSEMRRVKTDSAKVSRDRLYKMYVYDKTKISA